MGILLDGRALVRHPGMRALHVQVEQRSWGLWDLTDKICDAMMQSVKRGQASTLLGPSVLVIISSRICVRP